MDIGKPYILVVVYTLHGTIIATLSTDPLGRKNRSNIGSFKILQTEIPKHCIDLG